MRTIDGLTVECGHVETDEHDQEPSVLLVADRDEHGRWTDRSTGEALGSARLTPDETGRPHTPAGRGRLAHLDCSTCHRSLWRRGLPLGRDLDACAAAGMDRVDLRVLELRAGSVR